jgi:hypothetical protein
LLGDASEGIFDRRTEEAVHAFQLSRKLVADGIVGPDTWRALAEAGLDIGSLPPAQPGAKPPPHPFMRVGSSGPHVSVIQAHLHVEPTAVFDVATEMAVRTFQERNGLYADGIVGRETWAALVRAGLNTIDLPPFGTDETLAVSDAVRLAHDRRRADPLTAYDVVAELLAEHPEYADGRAGSFDVGPQPPRAERLFFAEWLARVRPLFDSKLVDKLTTRTVVWGLALLDGELQERLEQDGFLAAFRAHRTERILSPEGRLALLSDTPKPPAEPTSWLPGFSTDAADGAPLLGIRERVEFLTSVLTARNLETPLAIGLFGDWGSGKSFFMHRMQERINVLADESARAEERGESTLYCSHVRQLTFNAWLYSDGDIWPSFAAQIFRSVTGAADDVQPGETQAGSLSEYQERLRNLDEQRKEAEREEATLGRRLEELDAEITQREAALPTLADDLGPEARIAARLVAVAREMGLLIRRLVSNWRQVSPVDLAVVLVPLVAVGAALVFGWSWTAATLLAVAASVATLFLNSLRYVDRATRERQEISALRDQRQQVEVEHESRAEDRAAVEQTLGVALELPLLPQYADEQAARWTSREQLGVVTEIRLAFERLSKLIDASQKARQADPQDRERLPIDRVVIYIDDLDRCPHDVVVRVLETIKVLIDLPHFVVVVGVDSRWLFRSIEVRFSELLQRDDPDDPDAAWSATPQNYLEKIFQYSVVLRPLQESGFAELIDSLIPPEASTDETGRKAAPPTESAITAEIEERPSDGEEQTREPAGAERAGTVSKAAGSAGLDLMPGSLIVTREEVAFMKRLAPLFETPRAAKRLANVYRLLRVSTAPGRLADPDGYEPVLVLLSIGIAFPGLAGEVFRAIAENPGGTIAAVIRESVPDRTTEAPGKIAAWEKLERALSRVSAPGLSDRQLETFRDWIPVVTEFSFHPWQELLPAETPS